MFFSETLFFLHPGSYGPHHLEINDYVNFLGDLGKMKVWHPWKVKKSKSLGPFWSY